jgi:hypothetical protein
MINPREYFTQLALLLLSLLAAAFLGGCATKPTQVQTWEIGSVSGEDYAKLVANNRMPQRRGFWDAQAYATTPGEERIVINLKHQRAFYYKGNELVGMSPVATGKEGHETPDGMYTIIEKQRDHASSLYGKYVDAATGQVVRTNVNTREDSPPSGAVYEGAPMPYFLRLKHHDSGITSIGLHGGLVPRGPASHGCIRLPDNMAQQFFRHAQAGMPVRVERADPRSRMVAIQRVPESLTATPDRFPVNENGNMIKLPAPRLPGDRVY